MFKAIISKNKKVHVEVHHNVEILIKQCIQNIA